MNQKMLNKITQAKNEPAIKLMLENMDNLHYRLLNVELRVFRPTLFWRLKIKWTNIVKNLTNAVKKLYAEVCAKNVLIIKIKNLLKLCKILHKKPQQAT